ncbi:MAG: PIN domain-containing protein [Terriglobia bacterium]
MDAILLDTDVFSFLLRRGDTRGELYRPLVKDKTIALSFVSVGELYVWSVKRKWAAKTIAAFEEKLKATVIVPYDLELCREYGRVKASLPEGRVVPANDLWIAVCAIRHSIPLLTHNQKHFEGIPRLKLISQTEKPEVPKATTLFDPAEGN